jgi:2,4-dienoyl-CoA reductase-like NADH-dependent reductase (Old Yellow Enzyme family)
MLERMRMEEVLKTRLTLEVLEAVQSEWPNCRCLFVGTDWADGGWNAEESVQLSIL